MKLYELTVAIVSAQWKRETGNRPRSAHAEAALAAWGRWTSNRHDKAR